MRIIALTITCLFLISVTASFHNNTAKQVRFNIEIDKEVYTNSLWGDAPQFALWLVNRGNRELSNVCITHRTARNDWIGKASCPVSLPIWTFHNVKYDVVDRIEVDGAVKVDAISGASIRMSDLMKNIFTRDSQYKLRVDGVSCATPKNNIKGYLEINENEIYEVFFEINCSGDYNEFYQSKNMDSGETDYYGNGQPSIVYKGLIDMMDMKIEQPVLYGQSHQNLPIDEINILTDNITTAKELVKEISIKMK